MGGSMSSPEGAVTTKCTIRGESKEMKVRYAVSGMQGMRQTMEDRHLFSIGIPVLGAETMADHAIFAVFDGHGGEFTSDYLEEHFLTILSRRPELVEYSGLPKSGIRSRSEVNGIHLFKEALYKTFLQLDEKLRPLHEQRTAAIQKGLIPPPLVVDSDPEDDLVVSMQDCLVAAGERSGSTAVVVVVTPTHYICANTGDSRAILRRNGKALPLSFDHKPSNIPERIRISSAGGFVRGKRVNGDLAVSRALGDFLYKDGTTMSAEMQKVSAEPEMVIYPRDAAADEFVILACDGVWDVASNKQCSDFVQLLLAEGELDLGYICEEVLDTCLDRSSRDNMTMMMIGLPAMKADTTSTASMNNAIWGHRSARRARDFAKSASHLSNAACSRLSQDLACVEQKLVE